MLPLTSAIPRLYINRELSWLAFNERVLAQAQDPIIRCSSGSSSWRSSGTNLDEFFMVRVATILKKFRAGIEDVSIDGLNTEQQLAAIRARALAQLEAQTLCWTHACDRCWRPRASTSSSVPTTRRPSTRTWRTLQEPDLPGADAAGLRSGPSVSVHLEPQHEPRGARPARRADQVRARQGAGHAAALHRRCPTSLSPQPGQAFVFLEDVIRRNIQELFPGTQVEGAHSSASSATPTW
jgi:polyphosphate kinase